MKSSPLASLRGVSFHSIWTSSSTLQRIRWFALPTRPSERPTSRTSVVEPKTGCLGLEIPHVCASARHLPPTASVLLLRLTGLRLIPTKNHAAALAASLSNRLYLQAVTHLVPTATALLAIKPRRQSNTSASSLLLAIPTDMVAMTST